MIVCIDACAGTGAAVWCGVVCDVTVNPRQQDPASPTPQHPLCRANRQLGPAAETRDRITDWIYSTDSRTKSQGGMSLTGNMCLCFWTTILFRNQDNLCSAMFAKVVICITCQKLSASCQHLHWQLLAVADHHLFFVWERQYSFMY